MVWLRNILEKEKIQAGGAATANEQQQRIGVDILPATITAFWLIVACLHVYMFTNVHCGLICTEKTIKLKWNKI